jgi:hypothetical protein
MLTEATRITLGPTTQTHGQTSLVLRTAIAPPVWRGRLLGYYSRYSVPKPGQDFRRYVLCVGR